MSREKIVRLFAYGLSIVLVATYMLILWSARSPQVSLEYKMYYIERTLREWPGNGGLAYELGTKESFATDDMAEEGYVKRLTEGWSYPEVLGIWTDGEQASLIYIITDTVEEDLTLEMEIPQYISGVSVQVYANEEWIGRFDEVSGKVISLRIPQACLQEDSLIISFRIENPVCPAEIGVSPDVRYLGIMMSSATIVRRTQ